MAQFPPERHILEDKLSSDFFFEFIRTGAGSFEFDDMLRLWFAGDVGRLRAFLEWLRDHGLEIRKKNV